MSDASQGPGWWQASDGKWYPPADSAQPAPGWWLASDGNWYPPEQAPTGAAPDRAPVDPAVRKAVRPVAKPRSVAPTAAMGTPPGPAVAPKAVAPIAHSAPLTPPKPTAPKPTAAAPTKPTAASPKGPDAAPATAPGGVKPPPGAESRPTLSGGLSPDLQIRVRDEQSRRDAAVLLDARKSAASRALDNIGALIDQEQAAPPRELRETGGARAATAAAANATPEAPTVPAGRTTPAAPKSKGKMGRVIKAGLANGPAASAMSGGATDEPIVVDDPRQAPEPERIGSSDPPLLEVKQGTLAADIEHIGERLVIFNDRVELHDRSDRVRQVIAGSDIADVVVHKKFTGSTVTVESGTGESIVAKGLKPEQADEIRAVILKRTRAGVPSGTAPAERPARPDPRETVVDAHDPKPEPALSRAEGAELFAKLADLHRVGVLTDDELAEKRALVEALVEGSSLAVSTPSA